MNSVEKKNPVLQECDIEETEDILPIVWSMV